MDFMSDELYDGRRIRLLTLVDNFTRESLAIEVAQSLGGQRVVEVLMDVVMKRGLPGKIRVDNGPEFTSSVYWPIVSNTLTRWLMYVACARVRAGRDFNIRSYYRCRWWCRLWGRI